MNPFTSAQSLSRRRWFSTGLAGAALLASRPWSLAADPQETRPPEAAGRLKISSFYNYLPGPLPERLAFLEKAGVEGVELRGVKLPDNVNGSPIGNPKYFAEVLRDSKLKPTALDFTNLAPLISDSPEIRLKFTDSLKRAIDVAAELKAPNLITVPPRLNAETVLPDPNVIRKVFLETLPALGERAAQAGICIMIEPIDRHAGNCLHVVADVASLVRDCNTPGLGIVADFCIMMEEETSITGAFLSGGSYIRQVHLSSLHRKMPGQGKDDEARFREGFRGMKIIGYPGYCSFECGTAAGFSKDLLPAMEFLRRVWEQA